MEKGFILSLIFAAIIAVFALKNGAKVPIDLFFTEVQMSQAIIILISALFGAIIAAAFSWVRSLKLNKKIKNLNHEISDLDVRNKELHELTYSKDQQINDKDEQIKTLSKEIVDSPRQGTNQQGEYGQTVRTDVEADHLVYPASEIEEEN